MEILLTSSIISYLNIRVSAHGASHHAWTQTPHRLNPALEAPKT